MKFPFTIKSKKEINLQMIRDFIQVEVEYQVFKNLSHENIWYLTQQKIKELVGENLSKVILEEVLKSLRIKIEKKK